ncbi:MULTISPECIES: hypothetical protein [Chryseobacterium]|uniref:Molecular chaperone GroES n=1 Tax=Chryseobacterium rhizosphaerae TaxID=395937 RepID=A0ABX9IK94_9FLAO|nr:MULTISPECIES: hypothetical protein [Chryseobacterium]MBL3549340.1 hypothetical protein [Chryseobacterium sp. KMC2]REC74229.1 hypothetical protein DRF57_14375 [Chryseobacterium rhizosphaerae]GEN68368.1 hypothetical protein CRH01_29360 [Chryseobacterium rhizosphaerae]
MKNLAIIFSVLCFQFWNAQNVYLIKVEKTNDNQDKFLYRKDDTLSETIYLGEVEVQGFTKDDAGIFSLVYKKAKEIGANAFALKPFENVDGTAQPFNPANYKIALYYTPKEKWVGKDGMLYVFASSEKAQKISVNQKDYTLQPRTFIKVKIVPGEIYTVSTKKLLGSTIKVQPKDNKDNMYFQISSLKVKSDTSGNGGLNLKSGDVHGLEKSYAEFLSLIYKDDTPLK